MTKEIITAIASIIGTVLAAVVPLIIQNRSLKRRLEEAPTIARGLAVGYFQNFLRPVSSILKESMLEVLFPPAEARIAPVSGSSQRLRKFSNRQVEIVLIVPKRLTAAAISHAIDEARLAQADLRQAEVLRPGAQRGFTVNYDLLERGGETILVIRDLVKPYSAIKYYAEDYLKMDQDSEPWRKMEQDTLSEFRQTIERLRNQGEGVGINQISWKEIE
ncbi:MAG TPA: STING domain-containing protein [Chthoniobacterales bacterium]|jgi:hypothetical protein